MRITKLEEAVRAIYAKRPDCEGKPWPINTDRDRRAYPHNPIAAVDLSYEYARAAVEALRVPSDEIRRLILDYDDLHLAPGDLWENLIDAILKEKP